MSAACGQRICLVGTTGSGKTTVARLIAQRLALPHVELDALFWGPDWTPAPPDVFRERVAAALTSGAWVADGNYSKVRDIVWGRADTLVWLDYPLPTVLGRLLGRTLRRCLKREELWGNNRESLRQAFLSRDSIILYMLRHYRRTRRTYRTLLSSPEYRHLAQVVLRSGSQTCAWLERLQPQDGGGHQDA